MTQSHLTTEEIIRIKCVCWVSLLISVAINAAILISIIGVVPEYVRIGYALWMLAGYCAFAQYDIDRPQAMWKAMAMSPLVLVTLILIKVYIKLVFFPKRVNKHLIDMPDRS